MDVHVIDPGVIGRDDDVDNHKDLLGFSLRRDWSLDEKAMLTVKEQFLKGMEQVKVFDKEAEIGAFFVVAFGRKPTGEVGGIVASGGSNITNMLMADFIDAIYTAQLRANGMCRCPSCYARGLVAIKNYLEAMEQGSSGQVPH